MKNNITSRIGALGLGGLVLGAALASCSGGSAGTVSADGGAALDGASGSGATCSADSDCASQLPATNPPNCATAKCDAIQGVCSFVAKDADGDGHTAANCKAVGTGSIQDGDDCDDADPTTYPGAPDICDGKNHTCGTTKCACTNGTTQACYTGPAATRNVGECKDGSQTCALGAWGACGGETLPQAVDACDGKDENCDGTNDTATPPSNCHCSNGATSTCNATACNPTMVTCSSGVYPACPAAQAKGTYSTDADKDGYCAAAGAATLICPEAATASQILTSTCKAGVDCNDSATTGVNVHPNATEVCNGVDDNCNGLIDDGVPTAGACAAAAKGACAAGTSTCVAGSYQCVASAPRTEGCDPAQDLDCNGIGGDGASGGPFGAACLVTVYVQEYNFGTTGLCSNSGLADPTIQIVRSLTAGYDQLDSFRIWASNEGVSGLVAIGNCSDSLLGSHIGIGTCAGAALTSVIGYVSTVNGAGSEQLAQVDFLYQTLHKYVYLTGVAEFYGVLPDTCISSGGTSPQGTCTSNTNICAQNCNSGSDCLSLVSDWVVSN